MPAPVARWVPYSLRNRRVLGSNPSVGMVVCVRCDARLGLQVGWVIAATELGLLVWRPGANRELADCSGA